MIVAALVGMAGAGKSEAASLFMNNGFIRIRFGDITDEEIKKRGLILNEENERSVREGFRKEHGMAAYAILNLPRIEEALKTAPVIIDGLYQTPGCPGDSFFIEKEIPARSLYQRSVKERHRRMDDGIGVLERCLQYVIGKFDFRINVFHDLEEIFV